MTKYGLRQRISIADKSVIITINFQYNQLQTVFNQLQTNFNQLATVFIQSIKNYKK
jgi:hypothetical protein